MQEIIKNRDKSTRVICETKGNPNGKKIFNKEKTNCRPVAEEVSRGAAEEGERRRGRRGRRLRPGTGGR